MTDTAQIDTTYEQAQLQEKEESNVKLFGRWTMQKLIIDDETLRDQMELSPKWLPHTLGRYQKKKI